MEKHFTLPKQPIYTFPATSGNQITPEYYWFLVGEINRGTIEKAVCRIEYPNGHNMYYLISVMG